VTVGLGIGTAVGNCVVGSLNVAVGRPVGCSVIDSLNAAVGEAVGKPDGRSVDVPIVFTDGIIVVSIVGRAVVGIA